MAPQRINATHFSPDIQEFIRLFAIQEVNYVIVGGEAVEIFLGEKVYPAYYLGLDQLIRNKESVKRPRDLEDLKFLYIVKKRQKEK